MPIEIRELNIKVSVNQSPPEQNGEGPGGGSQPLPDKDQLIAECVEQVLDILKSQRER
jgi:hypothetical protein